MSGKTDDSTLEYKILSEDLVIKNFCCGDSRYDEFITTTEALEHQREKLGTTYLFFYNDKCIGYITIAMGDLNKEKHSKLKKITHHDNIPGLFLAQMARAKEYRGKGLGNYLIRWVIGKAYTMSKGVGCRIVFLECEDKYIEKYQDNGFELIARRSKDKRNIMFVDLLDTICLKCGFVNSRDEEVCKKCGLELK